MLLHSVGVSCGMHFKKWNYYIKMHGYLQVLDIANSYILNQIK